MVLKASCLASLSRCVALRWHACATAGRLLTSDLLQHEQPDLATKKSALLRNEEEFKVSRVCG